MGEMNLGTMIVLLVVIAALVLVIRSMIINKKNGKGSCSCGGACSGCAGAELCHSKDTKA